MSDSLLPHGLQHTRLPCSSLSPGVCSDSCSLIRWCHPTISSFVIPFSSCSQSFLTSESFPKSPLFSSDGQSIRVSASVLPVNIQGWFPLGLTGLISLLSRRLSRVFSSTTSSLAVSLLYGPTLTSVHDYWKTIALTIWIFDGKVLSLLFNMLSRFAIAFLPRSKCLVISWLHSPSTVILEPKKMIFVTVSTFSPSICHDVMALDAMIFVFWMLNFKPAFSHSSFTFKRPFSSSLLSAVKVVSSAYLRLLIFLLAILIPACELSSLAFCMMYSVYKLNKQSNNVQFCHTLFPILNQSVAPCPILTVASWSAHRFLRRHVRWSSIPVSLRIFHSLSWSTSQRL